MKFLIMQFSLNWVPRHDGMACPHAADGGDGIQIWRIAANILNKQSRTADKKWSSRLEVGLTTPHCKEKKNIITKCYSGPLTWTESLKRNKQRKFFSV
jgi:hypothetical protein